MNSGPVKISVVITTYNSQNSIQKVINSIQNQEGINEKFELELLIIDDCSTDETVNILKTNRLNYTSTDTNSGGPNKGRNIGLKKSTGDYICIVDHDDEWHPDKIISLLPYLQKAPIITSGYTVNDLKTGKKTVKINRCPENAPYISFDANQTFLKILKRAYNGQNYYLGSIVYSNQLKDILFEEKSGMVDFDWVLRLFHQQCSIEVCKSLYSRNTNGTNLSLNEQYRLNDYHHSLQFVQTYKTKYPKEVECAVKKINGTLARYYYLVNNMPKARQYFLKSTFGFKTVLYYITTFAGADYIKRKFKVFG